MPGIQRDEVWLADLGLAVNARPAAVFKISSVGLEMLKHFQRTPVHRGAMPEISRGLSRAVRGVTPGLPPPGTCTPEGCQIRAAAWAATPSGSWVCRSWTGGIVGLRPSQPPANFWQPSRLRGGANRRRVLDLLASWQPLTDQYRCTLSQLVLAWTAAQPGVTHVLVGGRTRAQATENAQAGALELDAADLSRIRNDVVALGEPVKA